MASKFCSACTQKLLLSSFLADPFNPSSKIRATCINCRGRVARVRDSKRKALQPFDSNIPSKRPLICRAISTKAPSIPSPYIQSETRLETSIRPLPPLELRPETPLLIPPPIPELPLLPPPPPPPPPPPTPAQPTGFLPVDQ
jgi:hypothetical protein